MTRVAARRHLAAAAMIFPLALAGCAGGQTWQVVGVYTDPELPGDLPADAAGAVNFGVRGSHFKGSTGCADVSGTYTEADGRVELSDVKVADPGACGGGARHTHDQLAGLLVDGASYTLKRLSDYEVVLTAGGEGDDDPAADRPAIRLMLL